jgi:hypothetical protein
MTAAQGTITSLQGASATTSALNAAIAAVTGGDSVDTVASLAARATADEASISAIQTAATALSAKVAGDETANAASFAGVNAALATMATESSVDAKFAVVPKFVTVIIKTSDVHFVQATQQVNIPVLALPARGKVVGVTLKHDTAFAGVAGVQLSLGAELLGVVAAADANFYANPFDVTTAVADDNFYDTAEYQSRSMAAHNVDAVFTSTQNFGNGAVTALTAGQVEVVIGYVVLP